LLIRYEIARFGSQASGLCRIDDGWRHSCERQVYAFDKTKLSRVRTMIAFNRLNDGVNPWRMFFQTGAGSGSKPSQLPESVLEGLKGWYATVALQMQCPLHQKNARVELAGDRVEDLDIEVFTCCDAFAKRVRDTLRDSSQLTGSSASKR
jgi:hypothetical protein